MDNTRVLHNQMIREKVQEIREEKERREQEEHKRQERIREWNEKALRDKRLFALGFIIWFIIAYKTGGTEIGTEPLFILFMIIGYPAIWMWIFKIGYNW